MLIGRALLVEFLMMLFSLNSQELFEMPATDFIAGSAVTHHVLAHHFKDPWLVLNSVTRCSNYSYRSYSVSAVTS
jgi:hypothetical protein